MQRISAAWLHDGLGLWAEPLSARGDRARPALFLDRDGVIVEEVGYLHRVEDCRLVPGVADLIAAVGQAGVAVVIVTNQSGIGRGYYGWEEFATVQCHILALLAEQGAYIDMVLACAYHPNARPGFDLADHAWRKPGCGMLIEAAGALNLDLPRSWIVGDRASDVAAGRAAGIAGGVLVGAEAAEEPAALALAGPAFRALVVRSFEETHWLPAALGK